MKEKVFLNGKFTPLKEAKLSPISPGFFYGWGLFETMRAYNNRIVYLEEHLKRIKQSSKLINMRLPYSIEKLGQLIKDTVGINGLKDAYVKLTLWKSDYGTDILIMAKSYKPYSDKKYK